MFMDLIWKYLSSVLVSVHIIASIYKQKKKHASVHKFWNIVLYFILRMHLNFSGEYFYNKYFFRIYFGSVKVSDGGARS